MHHEGEDRERRPHRAPAPEGTELARYPVPEPLPSKPGAAVNSLFEYSTEAREDPNEAVVFGEMPERCACPHCEKSVVTFIDYEASWVTWLLGFVVWFSLGWMAFWVLPLLWPAFKDVVHHCPRCLNIVARKSRISLPTFRTEVCSLKIGNCAVVLARKYVIIFICLVGAIVGFYFCRSFVHLNSAPEVNKGAPSMLAWEDFLFDCGPRGSLRSRGNNKDVFEERYRRRTFKWQGEVRVIREGFEVLFLKTKSVLMVRMYPARFPRRDLPDVALLFSENLNKEIAELNPGDWVEYEATMTLHGYRGDPELMTLWHIKKVPTPDPLTSSPGWKSTIGNHGADVEKAELLDPAEQADAAALDIAAELADAAATRSAQGSDFPLFPPTILLKTEEKAADFPPSSDLPAAAVAVAESSDLPAAAVAVAESSELPAAAVAVAESSELPAAAVAVAESSELPAAAVAVAESSELPAAAVAVAESSELPAATVAVAESSELPAAAVAVAESSELPAAAVAAAESSELPAAAVAVAESIELPAVAVAVAESSELPAAAVAVADVASATAAVDQAETAIPEAVAPGQSIGGSTDSVPAPGAP